MTGKEAQVIVPGFGPVIRGIVSKIDGHQVWLTVQRTFWSRDIQDYVSRTYDMGPYKAHQVELIERK